MKQTLLTDGKKTFFYQSRLNDKTARDKKEKEVRQKGYKKINKGQYINQSNETIYFLTRR